MLAIPPGWTDFASRVGVPALLALVVLQGLGPKIDHGIAIADHVDAELSYLAVRGCAPLSTPSVVGFLP